MLRNSTVLVLDDTAAIRFLLRRTLEIGLYRVVEAATVDEAWAQIAVERPGVVIMELRLYDADPLDIARGVRRAPAAQRPWLLALTTMASDDDRDRALAAGVDEVMFKPFRPLELLERVEHLLGRGQPDRRRKSGGC
jgi:DNA-binding response OmpR family regulator